MTTLALSSLWLALCVLTAAAGAIFGWLLARVRHQTELGEVERRAAVLEQQVLGERQAAAEQRELLEQAEKSLRDGFQALAADALQRNNQSFLELAKASLGEHTRAATTDLDARK